MITTLAFERVDAPNATQYVIWMHGLGADGFDFIPLVPELRLPSTTFIFPHADTRPVTINGGMVMRAWYDIFTLDRLVEEDQAGLMASRQQVHALIDMLRAEGVDSRNIVLAGFSQGGVMALLTGLSYEYPLKAILALSCYLPLNAEWPGLMSAANKTTPIFMVHGTGDEVLPCRLSEQHAALLRQLGCDVMWRSYPMGHTVCPQEVADIRTFLAEKP